MVFTNHDAKAVAPDSFRSPFFVTAKLEKYLYVNMFLSGTKNVHKKFDNVQHEGVVYEGMSRYLKEDQDKIPDVIYDTMCGLNLFSCSLRFDRPNIIR